MSKYDPNKEPSSLAELEPLILAAQAELSALCNGKKFRMSIPVQDDDSDMVIGDALRHSLAFVKAALPVREAPQEAQQACCAPTPDRTGRTCDKPKGHSGPHWTYGGGTMTWDEVCEHGTALDVHCCNCHSGFIFDKDHECPSLDLGLYRCKFCGTRWLLWPDAIHGGGWNLLDKWQRPCACCDNVAMGEQVEHLRDIPVSGSPTTGSEPQKEQVMNDSTLDINDMIKSGPQPLPCPLCAGPAYAFWSVNGEQMFKVGCPPCGLELKAAWYRGTDKPTKDILTLWNTRLLLTTGSEPPQDTKETI